MDTKRAQLHTNLFFDNIPDMPNERAGHMLAAKTSAQCEQCKSSIKWLHVPCMYGSQAFNVRGEIPGQT